MTYEGNMLGERLRDLLNNKGITVKEFAEMCDLPLETVKNVYYGKTTDPKISTVMQMSRALNISVNCLMGQCSHTIEERALLEHYRACGNHGKNLILLTSKYEALTAKLEREAIGKHKIPCLIPREFNCGSIVYEDCEVREVDTTVAEAYVAIKMPGNDFAPLYCKGDIVLLANRFPSHNEYAVFYQNEKAYFMKYLEDDGQYRLQYLHNQGEDMVFHRMDQINYVGTYCGVIRS